MPKHSFTHAASLHQGSPHCAISPTAASRRSLGRVSVPMWPSALSGRLPIVALVGRCPANKLIGRGPIACRDRSLSAQRHAAPCAYAVLAAVSSRYPPACGRLSPRYSPVRHSHAQSLGFRLSPFDLHVLGTPPAFILSQDRTLMLFHVVLSPCPVCARLLAPASFLVYPLVHLGSF